MGLMAVGVLLIFAYELGWLAPFWDYIVTNWNSTVVGSIILLILIIWFMSYITKPGEKPSAGSGTQTGTQTGGTT